MSNADLFTTHEVALQLSVHPQTIYNWVRRGYMIPSATIGKSFVFTQSAIDNRETPPPAHRPKLK